MKYFKPASVEKAEFFLNAAKPCPSAKPSATAPPRYPPSAKPPLRGRIMLFVSAVECWRPRTANALRDYWRGSWRLTKQMTYERGGISGTFNGRATFAPLDQGNSSTWLAYADSGVATLGDDTLEARNSLLYECSSAESLGCYIDL